MSYKSHKFLLAEVLLSLMAFMYLVIFPKLDSLKEVFGVVGLSGLGDVLLNGQVENRN